MAAGSVSAMAGAGVITDFLQSKPDQLITYTAPYSFTHNLVDNGFKVDQDEVTSAELAITLTDAISNEEFGSSWVQGKLFHSRRRITDGMLTITASTAAAARSKPFRFHDFPC